MRRSSLASNANLLVNAQGALATSIGISEAIKKLPLVTFGSLLHELVVDMVTAYKHQMDIAIANVFGGKNFNILDVLFAPLPFSPFIAINNQRGMLATTMILLSIIITGWLVLRTARWDIVVHTCNLCRRLENPALTLCKDSYIEPFR